MYRPSTTTPRALLVLAVLTFILITSQLALHSSFTATFASPKELLTPPGSKQQNDTSQRATIARVYMKYGQGFYEDDLLLDEVYNQTMENHLAYDRKHGYETYVLSKDVYDGIWNKVVYLASIISIELLKPDEERLQWLCWTDLDTIIMNPEMSLETFLPPDDFDEVDFIVAEDWNGMNAGIFMLRISKWSLRYMSDVIAYRDYHEDEELEWEEQDAMANLLEAHAEYRQKVAYVPQHWINGYHDHRNDDASADEDELGEFDFRQGDLLIHFAGFGVKQLMPVYMDIAMQHDPAWEMPLNMTTLPQEIEEFWDRERWKREMWRRRQKELEEEQEDEEHKYGQEGDQSEEQEQNPEEEMVEEPEYDYVYVDGDAEDEETSNKLK